jgi:6-phosphogluconolactonase
MSIDPSGMLLLAGNLDSDTIVPFSIDQSTGALTPTGAVTDTPVPVAFAYGSMPSTTK